MATKVLIFESDPAFAAELRNELGRLGCSTQIVDDGNAGLQQAAADKPDLILLSIELPRMNGFSVCNKLKKDPALRDVPLIIMSSESTEETFEQHKKLRTRANDYVRKPIAFGELFHHIQPLVQLDARPSQMPPADGTIDIDDEVSMIEEEDDAMTQVASRHDMPQLMKALQQQDFQPQEVDQEMEAFAESAFGRLTAPSVPNGAVPNAMVSNVAPVAAPNGGTAMAAVQAEASPAAVVRRPSSRPPRPDAVDAAEHARVRVELDKAKERAQDLERELSSARTEVQRILHDTESKAKSDGEVQRLQREVDELKSKLAQGKAGAASSREFLDLREALNKKDKEILALREAASRKDKEAVEVQERSLSLERAKADLNDRILQTERDLTDAREKVEALSADKELAKKASEDFKTRLERTRAELEARSGELEEFRGKMAQELGARDAELASARAQFESDLSNERKRAAEELEETESRFKSSLEEALRKASEQTEELRTTLEREHAAALSRREQQIRSEAQEQMTAARNEQDQALEDLRAGHANEIRSVTARYESELERERETNAQKLEEANRIHGEQREAASLEAQSRIATVMADAKAEQERLQKEYAEERAHLADAHRQQLADADERRGRELAEAVTRRAQELAALEVRHRSLVETLKAEHAATLQSTETRAAERLAQRERELQQARDEGMAALERANESAIRERDEQHSLAITALKTHHQEQIAELENERESRLAAQNSHHQAELTELTNRFEAQKAADDDLLRSLEADLSLLRSQLETLSETKRHLEESTALTIGRLEADVRQYMAEGETYRDQLANERERGAAMDKELLTVRQELAATANELQSTRQRLIMETARADRAFSKWESDRGSLDRAKDALAVALAQIEEAESRSLG